MLNLILWTENTFAHWIEPNHAMNVGNMKTFHSYYALPKKKNISNENVCTFSEMY